MIRIILGVIGGFIAWSILWLGSDQVLRTLSPGWYGAHELGLENAFFNQTPFEANASIMLLHLVRSIVVSIMSGFLAAMIANEARKTTLILGVLLLAFGLYVQISVWAYIPVWYNMLFLVLLIPMTFVGGMLKKTT